MRSVRKLVICFLILAFTASLVYITAAAGTLAYGAATVEASSLNIRSGPDTSSSVVLTVNQNEIIVILEQTSSEWYHVNYHGTEGYVASMYLTNVLKAENFTATGKVTGDDVLMRSAPSTSGDQIRTCDSGTVVKLIGINNGWYKLKYSGETGYIRSDFITIIADEATGEAPAAVAASSTVDDSQLSLRQKVINFAMKYIGYDYVYGGTSPSSGFDCSGLVYYVFNHFDYDLTRTASSQYAQDGEKIKKSELQPGDLVFFSSNGGYSVTHVGIYIGNNEFVHASSPKIGVVISSLDSNYYTNVWYGAKRILA